MALHKFTPGGCRQDCGSSGVTVDCPCTPPCDAGTTRNSYHVTWNVPGGGPSGGGDFVYSSANGEAGCTYTNGSTYTVCGESCYGVLYIAGATALFMLKRVSDNAVRVSLSFTTLLGTADCSQDYALDAGASCCFAPCGNVPLTTASVTPNGTTEVACIETPYTIPANPNSCCPCENCRLLRDDFNRAAGTDLGANWTETAGSWEIVDPSWARVSSASSLLLSASAASQVGVQVEVFARGYSDGDILRLVACYQSADDYVFAEWKVGSTGYLRLYRRASGSNTLIDEVTPIVTATNRVQRWTLCIQSDGAFASTTLYSNPSGLDFEEVAAGIIATAAAGRYGLASGATVGAYVEFTRFALNSTAEGCERCTVTCEMCDPNATDLIVDLGSAIHNAGTCMGLVSPALYPCSVPAGSYALSPGPIPPWLDSANEVMRSLYGANCATQRDCEWLYRDSGCKFYIYLRIGADRDASLNPTVRITVFFILADEATVTTCNWHAYSVEISAPATTVDCTAGWTLDRCDTFPPFTGQPTPPTTIDVYPA